MLFLSLGAMAFQWFGFLDGGCCGCLTTLLLSVWLESFPGCLGFWFSILVMSDEVKVMTMSYSLYSSIAGFVGLQQKDTLNCSVG